MSVSDARFKQVFDVLERRIEERYGIPVRITDVPDPFTGDLDGAEIHVDFMENPESALFILVHLFGHTIQWNLDPDARAIGLAVFNREPTPEILEKLSRYERQACQYSLRLMHDAGIHDLDQWVSDFAACDYAYLEHFYLTGEKRPIRSFWIDGTPVLEPLDLPDFRPGRWMTRVEGGVVI